MVVLVGVEEPENPAKMPLAQIAEPWPTMELLQLETEVMRWNHVDVVFACLCFIYFIFLMSFWFRSGNMAHKKHIATRFTRCSCHHLL